MKTSIVFIISINENYSNQLLKSFPAVFYSIHPLFVAAAIYIFVTYIRKLSIEGLGKQLMKIWLFIIGINILSPIFFLILKRLFQADISIYSGYKSAISLITFALGYYITYILTDYKLTKWLCAIYTVLGLIALVPGVIPIDFTDYLWPFTFLVLGGYLEYKRKKARG